MKLSIILGIAGLLLLGSCGTKKNTTRKTNKGVVLSETKPINLPTVNETEHVLELKKNNAGLNKKVLNYIEKYAPIAVDQMYSHKIPASITLAQGILESSSGTSELALKSNNHFGIKCHTNWQGESVSHDDDKRGECFRKYKYVATSYKDHSEFLTKRARYKFLFNYPTTDYKSWAKGLKKAGYATDRKYPNKLIKIIETYQLYAFDNSKKLRDKNHKSEKDYKPEKTTKPQKTIGNYYQVKKGDTLYAIAKKFNISVSMLKEINGLKDNTISIGQHLLVK